LLDRQETICRLRSTERPSAAYHARLELDRGASVVSLHRHSGRARCRRCCAAFSAPVNLVYDHTDEELAFLASHDSDPVNRWNAAQRSFADALLSLARDIAMADRSRYRRPLR
jgi:aminopeptidase N